MLRVENFRAVPRKHCSPGSSIRCYAVSGWQLVKVRYPMNSATWTATQPEQRSGSSNVFAASAVPLFALVLVGGVLILPIALKDRSCHNLFPDGRNHASPELSIDLSTSIESWDELQAFFDAFSRENGLEFRCSIDHSSAAVSVLSLSMCKEPGFSIRSNEQYWNHRGGSPIPGRGIGITVFSLYENTDWKPIARRLVDDLNEKWPSKGCFRDGGGHLIPLEETAIGITRTKLQDEA